MKISELRKILQMIETAGHGDETIEAYHDVLCLLPPGTLDEEGEVYQDLVERGCAHCESHGLHIKT